MANEQYGNLSFAALLAGLPLAPPSPASPSKWTNRYRQECIERSNKRIEVLSSRIDGITQGRVMPDREQVTIGSGKRFNLAVLFLDICSFSSRLNWTMEEQKAVLIVMNIFMAEMLNIVRDFGGTFEKNTGDGLMAYFGEEAGTDTDRIRPAVEAALVMHHVNDTLMTPWFRNNGVMPVCFRIGIDVGPVTIARVGIRGDESSIVAIGTTANIASKLMDRIPNGGVCIGNEVYRNLPNGWAQTCRPCSEPSGFVYIETKAPYHPWELNHRLSVPMF